MVASNLRIFLVLFNVQYGFDSFGNLIEVLLVSLNLKLQFLVSLMSPEPCCIEESQNMLNVEPYGTSTKLPGTFHRRLKIGGFVWYQVYMAQA
jgi:hypothetical protein